MIADDARGIGSRKRMQVRIPVSRNMTGSGKRRAEQAFVAHTGSTAMLAEQPVMNGFDYALFKPDRVLRHGRPSLGKRTQRIAISLHAFFCQGHLSLELRIIGSHAVSVRRFRENHPIALRQVQPVNGFRRKLCIEGIALFANLQLDHHRNS